MNLDPMLTVIVVSPLVGALIWLVRLEGRVNLTDERHEDIRADIAEIKGDVRKIRSVVDQRRFER